ncbi:MAG: CBS domain-containing protein [Actinomycetota bacterium]|nr:CBS domain-containing protein [Actinomycetota bacterium]
MNDLLVRDIMHLGVVTCRLDTPLCEIAGLMVGHKIHCIVVVDEAGEACGVISDWGLLKAFGKDIKTAVAEDIIDNRLLTVRPNALVSEAASMMVNEHVHRLVVMSEPPLRRPVGVLAASDVVKEMSKYCSN